MKGIPESLLFRYWVDLRRNGHVVRQETYSRGEVMDSRLDITLAPFRVGSSEVWMPVSGESRGYASWVDKKLVHSKQPTVLTSIYVVGRTFEFNKHPGRDVFTIKYRPGTPISDNLRKLTYEFGQQKVGTKPTKADAEKMLNAQLAEAEKQKAELVVVPPSQSFDWTSWAAWGMGAVVLAASAVLWMQKARSLTSSPLATVGGVCMSIRVAPMRNDTPLAQIAAIVLLVLCTSAHGAAPEATTRLDCGAARLYLLHRLQGHRGHPRSTRDSIATLAFRWLLDGRALRSLQRAGPPTRGSTSCRRRQGSGCSRHRVPSERRKGGHYVVLRPVGTTGTMVQVIEPPHAPWITDYRRLFAARPWTGRILLPREPWLVRHAVSLLTALACVTLLALGLPRRNRSPESRIRPAPLRKRLDHARYDVRSDLGSDRGNLR